MPKLASPSIDSVAILLPPPTPSTRALALRVGSASHPAPGKPNEDFHAVVTPYDAEGLRQGVVLAVADGVSGSALARIASEVTVRSVATDYYSTPAHWSVGRALDQLLCSANDWLWAQNARRPDEDCVVTAISIVVLRDQHYYLAHVGDTRVYRCRERVFKQLTSDHTWQRKDMRHVLRRAVGLDRHLVVDFADGELRAGDVFLMLSDGVWEVLGDLAMTEILRRDLEPQPLAQALVQAAVRRQAAYMGRNDATAIVFCVDALVES